MSGLPVSDRTGGGDNQVDATSKADRGTGPCRLFRTRGAFIGLSVPKKLDVTGKMIENKFTV